MTSSVEYYSGGYGYRIEASTQAATLKATAKDFLARNQQHLDWVIQEFGRLNSSELELVTTIIFVDRERRSTLPLSLDKLAETVHTVKPHFDSKRIRVEAGRLIEKGILPVRG